MPSAAMRDSAKKSAPPGAIEYSVYSFQKSGGASGDRWKKHDSFSDMTKAVEQAETLFATDEYCRVEIKQKYTDPKNNRCVDMTLKTYERKGMRISGTVMALGGAVACGVIAFIAAYIVGTKM